MVSRGRRSGRFTAHDLPGLLLVLAAFSSLSSRSRLRVWWTAQIAFVVVT
jgi:hypothetical protein